ncbi:MAG: hypothetical protein WDZ89_02605 [Gemmatimonadota bacterium]
MFDRCLMCHAPFPANEALEHFSHGDRIAFDPGRGRLWSICRQCRRWTLAPIEARWEALEELERATTDRARLLSQTDNVALLRVDGLEVVRVGRANLTEEAWWRYGRELVGRREHFRKVSFAGSVAAGAVIIGGWTTGGIGAFAAWILWDNAPAKVVDTVRWFRFGSAAWRGERRCTECGHRFRQLSFKDRETLILRPDREHSETELVQRCPRCSGVAGGLVLRGREGDRALRRVLAYHHFAGASEKRVKSATQLIQEAGDTRGLARSVVREGKRLGDLERTPAIALEIAANEEAEQRLLELELADLETHWREEEELAAIVDGELTPLPVLETFRRRVRELG